MGESRIRTVVIVFIARKIRIVPDIVGAKVWKEAAISVLVLAEKIIIGSVRTQPGRMETIDPDLQPKIREVLRGIKIVGRPVVWLVVNRTVFGPFFGGVKSVCFRTLSVFKVIVIGVILHPRTIIRKPVNFIFRYLGVISVVVRIVRVGFWRIVSFFLRGVLRRREVVSTIVSVLIWMVSDFRVIFVSRVVLPLILDIRNLTIRNEENIIIIIKESNDDKERISFIQ